MSAPQRINSPRFANDGLMSPSTVQSPGYQVVYSSASGDQFTFDGNSANQYNVLQQAQPQSATSRNNNVSSEHVKQELRNVIGARSQQQHQQQQQQIQQQQQQQMPQLNSQTLSELEDLGISFDLSESSGLGGNGLSSAGQLDFSSSLLNNLSGPSNDQNATLMSGLVLQQQNSVSSVLISD